MPIDNKKQILDYRYHSQHNPYFCILPFNHFHIGTMGECKPCCVANRKDPIEDNMVGKSIVDIWSGEQYKKIRTQMVNGEPVEACSECYKIDKAGGGSDRAVMTKHFDAPANWEIDIERGNTAGYPTWVDIRPGRLCNLKCRMCFSGASSKIADELNAYPHLIPIVGDRMEISGEWIDDPLLFKNLQELIPHIHTMKLAGGEPFFMPGVIKLLKWCVDSGNTHINLDITTNGTRLNGKVPAWLKEFRTVVIQLSIDGIGHLNDYIRHGSNWDQVNKAFYYYLNNNINTSIMTTVQLYNAHYLTDIIRYWVASGMKYKLLFNFLEGPPDLSIHLLPMDHKLKIADEIEALVKGLSDEVRVENRFNYIIEQFRHDKDMSHLRQQWITRTDALDAVRQEQLKEVNPELFKLYTLWKSNIRSFPDNVNTN
jgi:sulfatase maturation enzyme AslB (radical SAM superfamily)